MVIVHDEASVSRALTTAYDLVLVGYDDRGVIEHAAGAATPAPTLLPVMNKPTKAVMEACKRQYDCRLKTSDRLDEFLKAMDEAMSVRKKAAAGKTR